MSKNLTAEERRLISQIDALESEIADLEDDKYDLEQELFRLRQFAVLPETVDVAEQVKALPFVTGALIELADKVINREADAEIVTEIKEYLEARTREINLGRKEAA